MRFEGLGRTCCFGKRDSFSAFIFAHISSTSHFALASPLASLALQSRSTTKGGSFFASSCSSPGTVDPVLGGEPLGPQLFSIGSPSRCTALPSILTVGEPGVMNLVGPCVLAEI